VASMKIDVMESRRLRNVREVFVSCVVAFFATSGLAQARAGQGLAQLVDANERFGRKLLLQVHAGSPERNIVVSPISVSILLAALQENSYNQQLHEEIDRVFGWGKYPRLSVPARMLLAAFEEPGPRVMASPGAVPAA